MGSRFFAPDEQKQNWGALFAIDVFTRKSAALLGPLSRLLLSPARCLPQRTYRAATRSDLRGSSDAKSGLILWFATTPPVLQTVQPSDALSAKDNH